MKRLAGLDALRGIAALGVAVFHFTYAYSATHPGFTPSFSVPAGRYGVDLFFVISGFVIFMTLERAASVWDFAISRFARLYPVFWTTLLLIAVLVVLDGGHIDVGTILANATMVPHMFGESSVDLVYWTLSYEFQFYVLAAGFLLSRSDKVELACLGWLLAAVLVMSYAPHVVTLASGATYAYLFVIGIMVYRLHNNSRNLTSWAVLATAIFVAGRIPFTSNEHISGLSNAALACVLAAALWFGVRVRPPRLFAYLGEISYGLYLIHDPIGSGLYLINDPIGSLAVLNLSQSWGASADFSVVLALLVAIGLAGIINAKIERPAQRWIKRYARGTQKQLAFGVG